MFRRFGMDLRLQKKELTHEDYTELLNYSVHLDLSRNVMEFYLEDMLNDILIRVNKLSSHKEWYWGNPVESIEFLGDSPAQVKFLVEKLHKLENKRAFFKNFTMATEQDIGPELSGNPNLTLKLIDRYYYLNWDFQRLLSNPNLPWIFLKYLYDSCPGEQAADALSRNPSLSFHNIQETSIPWNIKHVVAYNHNLTFDEIKGLLGDKLTDICPWNRNITLETVVQNPEFFKEAIPSLSLHVNIPFDYILAHPELPWCAARVSENQNVTPEIVRNNPEYPWNGRGLSRNPNFCLMDYMSLNYDLDKTEITRHPRISQLDILCYKEFEWHTDAVTQNPNISWRVFKNTDQKWTFVHLLSNDYGRIMLEDLDRQLQIKIHEAGKIFRQ